MFTVRAIGDDGGELEAESAASSPQEAAFAAMFLVDKFGPTAHIHIRATKDAGPEDRESLRAMVAARGDVLEGI